MTDTFESPGALRRIYPPAKLRSLAKQIDHLDVHCRRFIALSPFIVMASANAQGDPDASPRGGAPGFVHVLDEHTLLIPDARGNNRLDSLSNLTEAGGIGLLFMIPGVDETLRVNGRARLATDPASLTPFAADPRVRMAIVVTVVDAYLHCAKALMRSKLWHPETWVDRASLPTMGEMLNDQTGSQSPPESPVEMLARYAADL
ncbi:MAG: pyridoxamine 5'-phosphate oxidase family protein [Casimicrobium sp.]